MWRVQELKKSIEGKYNSFPITICIQVDRQIAGPSTPLIRLHCNVANDLAFQIADQLHQVHKEFYRLGFIRDAIGMF